jgi:hypothetical protein
MAPSHVKKAPGSARGLFSLVLGTIESQQQLNTASRYVAALPDPSFKH